jgi:hypothetical protein
MLIIKSQEKESRTVKKNNTERNRRITSGPGKNRRRGREKTTHL